ncbi:PAS domain-containing protein [Brucella sp. 21LCYQ03]|nr:PAS domain-containing protein [Brucella sp. 21LCYQ03]
MTLEDLYRLLRSGHVQAQGVVDTMTQPVVILDKGLCVTSANNAFVELFEVERDEVLGESLFDLGNGQWNIPDLRHLIEAVIPKAAAVVGYEVRHEFPSIGQKTFQVDARRLVHPEDSSSSILVTFDDVTERQRINAEQEFIIAETRHRMRNMFAVVRAVAMHTYANDPAALAYRDTFLKRLDVTLRAQEIAASGETSDLETLVLRAASQISRGRLRTEGPAVEVAGPKVLAVSMILHELTTNAVKYGAFSVPEGEVDFAWTIEPGKRDRPFLVCEWKEKNGPSVIAPTRKGYGTELIEGTSAQAGGVVELLYKPEGLTATIRIPM